MPLSAHNISSVVGEGPDVTPMTVPNCPYLECPNSITCLTIVPALVVIVICCVLAAGSAVEDVVGDAAGVAVPGVLGVKRARRSGLREVVLIGVVPMWPVRMFSILSSDYVSDLRRKPEKQLVDSSRYCAVQPCAL